MVVLEHIVIGELHIAEGTPMMPTFRLHDAVFAVDMATPSDIAVLNLVEADIAQELFF